MVKYGLNPRQVINMDACDPPESYTQSKVQTIRKPRKDDAKRKRKRDIQRLMALQVQQAQMIMALIQQMSSQDSVDESSILNSQKSRSSLTSAATADLIQAIYR